MCWRKRKWFTALKDRGLLRAFVERNIPSTDTAFIQLSKLSRKEKPLLVPLREKWFIGKHPRKHFQIWRAVPWTEVPVVSREWWKGHSEEKRYKCTTCDSWLLPCWVMQGSFPESHYLTTLNNQVLKTNYFLIWHCLSQPTASPSNGLNRKPQESFYGKEGSP